MCVCVCLRFGVNGVVNCTSVCFISRPFVYKQILKEKKTDKIVLRVKSRD